MARVKYSKFIYSFKAALMVAVLLFCFGTSHAQKPKDGVYVYSISFEEWKGKSLGAKCEVIVKGDSITVVHNGDTGLTGRKGDVIEAGLIMQHRSGKWIIGHREEDKSASETGGCSGGPTIVDFKKRKIRSC